MSKRPNIRREAATCCPAHTTNAVAQALADKWMADVRATQVNGGVDVIAPIQAAELIKRSMIAIGERGYAPHGAEAVATFRKDVETALAALVAIPLKDASS